MCVYDANISDKLETFKGELEDEGQLCMEF